MVAIEKVSKKDIEECLKIYNYYIENTTATFEEKPLTLSEFEKRVSGIAEKYPFLVAKDGLSVVGYAYFDAFNQRSAYRHTADLSIYLSKDCAGRGVGTILYKALEKSASELGIDNIISIITSENEKSVAFHEKNGFHFKGRLDNVGIKFGRILSVLFYQKTVGKTD